MNTVSENNFQNVRFLKSVKIKFQLFVVFSLTFFLTYSQEKPKDTIKTNQLEEVWVSAVRVTAKTPVSFSNLNKKELKSRNLGQDIPILMNYLPSVVTTSDAGAGIGYTGIRVRGSDATRINVTINGIPYNDSESHGTFWVNMPDFASSVESLQLQRGVGTSTNGSGAFGASLNLLTDNFAQESTGEIANSVGSFNTRKHTVKFSTGLLNDHFELAGRLSNIDSQGFIDRASSDLKSYFLQGTYVGKTTLIKALVFGGIEKTYQSWYGLEDSEKLKNDRTYNIAGQKYDGNGFFEGFYDNEIDNYQQDHYQLHWNEKWSKNWNSNLALHYTKGKGYFEQFIDNWYYTNVLFKDDASFNFLNITPIVVDGKEINSMDYIRRRWLENDFYGTTFSLNYNNDKIDIILGGGINKYEGNHYGEIIWAQYALNIDTRKRYYDNNATKLDANVFAKSNYQITKKLSLFGDLQIRKVQYKANSPETGKINESFTFFNPKAGLTYTFNDKQSIYFSYAKANREPNRTDYENGNPKPEKLDDFELGWRVKSQKTQFNINGYFMSYKNQLILTGSLDDVGNPIRANSGDSYRLGLEVEANVPLTSKLFLQPNVTLSQNKNKDFFFKKDGTLQNLGNTNIAFSPNIIAANKLTYMPVKNLQLALLSKFVGTQYMGNIDAQKSKLQSYTVSDLNFSYEFLTKTVFKSVTVSALINNIFNYEYESNGYFYTFDDDYTTPDTIKTVEGAGFYPQAGINFLIGLSLKL